MRLSLTESFTLALLTAAITAGLLNGYPPAPNGCRGNAPSSGLPEELVANCSGYSASPNCSLLMNPAGTERAVVMHRIPGRAKAILLLAKIHWKDHASYG